jgi:tetratricopeptide (TPR) repeat protein
MFERFRKKKKPEKKQEFKFTTSAHNEMLFSMATDCLTKNENDGAIRMFDEILETEPDNIHALNGKGSGLMQSGRLKEAERVFDKSLAVKDSEMAYLNKAIIYGNCNDYENAIKYCDKTMELFPQLKDVVQGMKSNFIENMNKNDSGNSGEFNNEAQELISRGNSLKDENKIWDAWDAYEGAVKCDPSCENKVHLYINELKNKLIEEFMFYDLTRNDDFDLGNELYRMKFDVMKLMLIDKAFTPALIATKQILTTIDANDLDAINYRGAISFYYDEIDEAIEYFDKVIEEGDEIYQVFGNFNKAFALRRKSSITGDLGFMVEALDIYDEMLKDPGAYDKVKPHQREILDKLQDFMGVPLY